MLEAGGKISEAEADAEVAELLAGKLGSEEFEEVKAPEPMEDIKGAPTGVKKEGGKAAAKISPEVEQFFSSFSKTKTEARELHRNGKYDDATEKYISCLKVLEKLKGANRLGLPAEEFLSREATINNNIAVCYKQKQDPTGVIAYSTKVIDSPVASNETKLKAYILRAYANEGIDKLKLAKQDWTKVKELHPDNIDASKALGRIQGALKQDEAQKVLNSVGEALRNLEEYKKRGNEFFKASKLWCITQNRKS